MRYFYNRETIQLFKTPKAAKLMTKLEGGAPDEGRKQADSTLSLCTPQPQRSAASKHLARFSSLQFSPLWNRPVLSEDSLAQECQKKEG